MRRFIYLSIAVLTFQTAAATAAQFGQTSTTQPQPTANSDFFTRLYRMIREAASAHKAQIPQISQPSLLPAAPPAVIELPPAVPPPPGNFVPDRVDSPPPPPTTNGNNNGSTGAVISRPGSFDGIIDELEIGTTGTRIPPPGVTVTTPNTPAGPTTNVPTQTTPFDPNLMPPLPPMPADGKAASVSSSSAAKIEAAKIVPTTTAASTPVSQTASLGQNNIFLAGDAFNTVQFARSGKAGFIVWRGNNLIYRERVNGRWNETTLSTSGNSYSPNPSGVEHRFQPSALLLFDSASHAHVLRQSGSSLVRHEQSESGSFQEVEQIPLPGAPELIDAQFGPDDTLHIALLTTSGSVQHGLIANGNGNWSTVAQTRGSPRLYLPQSFAPRYFSLAIDSRNKAHMVFTPELNLAIGPEGYTRPYSQLHYASNKSGEWRTQLVQDVADKSGDAAYGASIAIGPEDRPFIASWYNERAGTGSSQNSKLLWHAMDSSGNWYGSAIAHAPKGYVAGDGVRGTGFAPYLRFDENKLPHIVFSDHASQHFDSGQNEYAGQIRHVYFDGRDWRDQTIHAQSNPLGQQIIYPAFAVKNGELIITALERQTTWESDYRRANSTYNFLLYTTTY